MANKEPSAKDRIAAWRAEHPDGTQVQCIEDGIASRQTVYRVWPSDDPKRSRSGKGKAKGGRPKMDNQNRTERMTAFITPEDKRRLRYLCADDDITTSEWLARAIANAWGNRTD